MGWEGEKGLISGLCIRLLRLKLLMWLRLEQGV